MSQSKPTTFERELDYPLGELLLQLYAIFKRGEEPDLREAKTKLLKAHNKAYEGEYWLIVPGYEGKYEASNLGRVRSVSRYITNKHGSKTLYRGVVLKQSESGNGYLHVSLGDKNTVKVHQIVARAFIGESEKQINHIDGNKKNNHVDNLEYLTQSENALHAVGLGLIKTGSDNHNSKLTQQQVDDIRKRYSKRDVSYSQLASEYGVSDALIGRIVNNKTWKTQLTNGDEKNE